ncbi:T9SS C-terminal target domain-containing protein [Chryseobacterium nematophagum]|uniref:T9SS C-terminal target domain-containing protein n=1 Tax=Chryseobacterium nematophagum TaxID=2305228 RepID=A0A3M7TBJ5_9FLAO|nr:T9SS type A sorting domain-containing protein [Chryseobacterium nematophagum]RNA60731.1 T9SS C-terminal target domain-containing protein [Chryseobacterium nematophagum]
MKKSTILLAIAMFVSSVIGSKTYAQTQAPATLPYYQTFSMGNDFTFVNGRQVNKWSEGIKTGTSDRFIHVIADNAPTNQPTMQGNIVHAYREFSIPARTANATLKFDYKAPGKTLKVDGHTLGSLLKVWLVPTNYGHNFVAGVPIYGAPNANAVLVATLAEKNNWTTYINNTLNLSNYAGSKVRLLFEWTNMNSAQGPFGAIDNISLSTNQQMNKLASPSTQLDIQIYPNPVTEILYVKNLNKKVSYSIYRISNGEAVVNNGIYEAGANFINVSMMQPGYYTIEFKDEKGQVLDVKKFIKK